MFIPNYNQNRLDRFKFAKEMLLYVNWMHVAYDDNLQNGSVRYVRCSKYKFSLKKHRQPRVCVRVCMHTKVCACVCVLAHTW